MIHKRVRSQQQQRPSPPSMRRCCCHPLDFQSRLFLHIVIFIGVLFSSPLFSSSLFLATPFASDSRARCQHCNDDVLPRKKEPITQHSTDMRGERGEWPCWPRTLVRKEGKGCFFSLPKEQPQLIWASLWLRSGLTEGLRAQWFRAGDNVVDTLAEHTLTERRSVSSAGGDCEVNLPFQQQQIHCI